MAGPASTPTICLPASQASAISRDLSPLRGRAPHAPQDGSYRWFLSPRLRRPRRRRAALPHGGGADRRDRPPSYDPLTGLPNRALFATGSAYAFARSSPGRLHSRDLVDLDRFKETNDTLGHLVGDQVLIGRSQAARDVPAPGRHGGPLRRRCVAGAARAHRQPGRTARGRRPHPAGARGPLRLRGHDLRLGASRRGRIMGRRLERPEDLLRDADLPHVRAKAAAAGATKSSTPRCRRGPIAPRPLSGPCRAGSSKASSGSCTSPSSDGPTASSRASRASSAGTPRARRPAGEFLPARPWRGPGLSLAQGLARRLPAAGGWRAQAAEAKASAVASPLPADVRGRPGLDSKSGGRACAAGLAPAISRSISTSRCCSASARGRRAGRGSARPGRAYPPRRFRPEGSHRWSRCIAFALDAGQAGPFVVSGNGMAHLPSGAGILALARAYGLSVICGSVEPRTNGRVVASGHARRTGSPFLGAPRADEAQAYIAKGRIVERSTP